MSPGCPPHLHPVPELPERFEAPGSSLIHLPIHEDPTRQSMTTAAVGNDDSMSTVEVPNTSRGIDASRGDCSPMTRSSEHCTIEFTNPRDKVARQAGPRFKDQVQSVASESGSGPSPSPSPSCATRPSDSLDDQSMILTIVPIATAVLVPDASLLPTVASDTLTVTARVVRSHGSTTASVPPRIETIVETDEEDYDEGGTEVVIVPAPRRFRPSEPPEGAPPRSRRSVSKPNSDAPSTRQSSLSREEKKFWISVIAMAMCLNTLLVVGIVVGAFCASGSCRSTDEAPSPAATLLPTVAPSVARSDIPSVTPSQLPSMAPTVTRQLRPSVSPTPWTNGTTALLDPVNTEPSLVNITGEQIAVWNATISPSASYGPPERSDPDTSPPLAAPPERVANATQSPTPVPQPPPVKPPNATDTVSNGLNVGRTTAIAVALEALIVMTLYIYYRLWKSRRIQDVKGTSETEIDSLGYATNA